MTQRQMILTILAGWMNRKQQAVIEYLLEENRVLRHHPFTGTQQADNLEVIRPQALSRYHGS